MNMKDAAIILIPTVSQQINLIQNIQKNTHNNHISAPCEAPSVVDSAKPKRHLTNGCISVIFIQL